VIAGLLSPFTLFSFGAAAQSECFGLALFEPGLLGRVELLAKARFGELDTSLTLEATTPPRDLLAGHAWAGSGRDPPRWSSRSGTLHGLRLHRSHRRAKARRIASLGARYSPAPRPAVPVEARRHARGVGVAIVRSYNPPGERVNMAMLARGWRTDGRGSRGRRRATPAGPVGRSG